MVLTWDQDGSEPSWLVREYLPGSRDIDRPQAVPIRQLATAPGGARVIVVPNPHDCIDGFHGVCWRRTEAYLDPRIRVGISTYSWLAPTERDAGLRRLATDLESGV